MNKYIITAVAALMSTTALANDVDTTINNLYEHGVARAYNFVDVKNDSYVIAAVDKTNDHVKLNGQQFNGDASFVALEKINDYTWEVKSHHTVKQADGSYGKTLTAAQQNFSDWSLHIISGSSDLVSINDLQSNINTVTENFVDYLEPLATKECNIWNQLAEWNFEPADCHGENEVLSPVENRFAVNEDKREAIRVQVKKALEITGPAYLQAAEGHNVFHKINQHWNVWGLGTGDTLKKLQQIAHAQSAEYWNIVNNHGYSAVDLYHNVKKHGTYCTSASSHGTISHIYQVQGCGAGWEVSHAENGAWDISRSRLFTDKVGEGADAVLEIVDNVEHYTTNGLKNKNNHYINGGSTYEAYRDEYTVGLSQYTKSVSNEYVETRLETQGSHVVNIFDEVIDYEGITTEYETTYRDYSEVWNFNNNEQLVENTNGVLYGEVKGFQQSVSGEIDNPNYRNAAEDLRTKGITVMDIVGDVSNPSTIAELNGYATDTGIDNLSRTAHERGFLGHEVTIYGSFNSDMVADIAQYAPAADYVSEGIFDDKRCDNHNLGFYNCVVVTNNAEDTYYDTAIDFTGSDVNDNNIIGVGSEVYYFGDERDNAVIAGVTAVARDQFEHLSGDQLESLIVGTTNNGQLNVANIMFIHPEKLGINLGK